MANFPVTATYNPNLRQLETTDRTHANVFNPLFSQLLNNTAALKDDLDYGGMRITNVENAVNTIQRDYLSKGITATASGGPIAYNVTVSPSLSAYVKGLRLTLFVDTANTGPATLAIDSNPAVALLKNSGEPLEAGDLAVNTPYNFVYNGTAFLAVSGSGGGEILLEFEDYYSNTTGIQQIDGPAVLQTSAYALAGAATNAIAFFGGGYLSDSITTSSMTYYNTNLVKATRNLGSTRGNLIAGSVGDQVLFAGGQNGNTTLATVEAFNNNATLTNATSLSESRERLAVANVGNYVLFAGGLERSTNTFRNTVDAYNSNLVRTTVTPLVSARNRMQGTENGKYAIFAGGFGGSYTNVADAYNEELVRLTVEGRLSVPRAELGAARAGNYAVFAGGYNSTNGHLNTVDSYNQELIITTRTALSDTKELLSAAELNDNALFAGGSTASGYLNSTDVYNANLVKSVLPRLPSNLRRGVGVSFRNYALFAGGEYNNSSINQSVFPYRETLSSKILVTAGSKYKLNSTVELTASQNISLNFSEKVTGYVKLKSNKILGVV